MLKTKNTMSTKHIHNKNGKGLFSLFVFLIVLIVVAVVIKPPTVCERPLKYGIGIIDNEFEMTKETFLELLTKAEAIWEEGTGMDLFTYNKDAEFKINLIFDERQRATITEKRLRESLDKNDATYDEIVGEYNDLESLYNKQFEQYQNKIKLYEKQLSEYNDKVEYYNKVGGAPRKEYNKLEIERTNLESKASQIEREKEELNSLGNKANSLVEKINSFANIFNSKVNQYNEAFGTARTFDQGEYTGSEINIYQFDTAEDLRIVLGHEFGHALNLNHVENPYSIMYYLMEKQSPNDPKLSNEDIAALNVECGLYKNPH